MAKSDQKEAWILEPYESEPQAVTFLKETECYIFINSRYGRRRMNKREVYFSEAEAYDAAIERAGRLLERSVSSVERYKAEVSHLVTVKLRKFGSDDA